VACCIAVRLKLAVVRAIIAFFAGIYVAVAAAGWLFVAPGAVGCAVRAWATVQVAVIALLGTVVKSALEVLEVDRMENHQKVFTYDSTSPFPQRGGLGLPQSSTQVQFLLQ